MRMPAKIPFSREYSKCGICGAVGLLDQGFSDESDIAQTGIGGWIPTGDEGGEDGEVKDTSAC